MEINQTRDESLLSSVEESIKQLQRSAELSFDEVISILKSREQDRKTKTLPISIFNNTELSALETTVKYLKEDLGLNYRKIAVLLARNYDCIAITYRKSRRKMPKRLARTAADSEKEGSETKRPENRIPIDILRNKSLSVLENLVSYLKEELNLTYHEIAVYLNRDDRTVWTVYQRALKKLSSKKASLKKLKDHQNESQRE